MSDLNKMPPSIEIEPVAGPETEERAGTADNAVDQEGSTATSPLLRILTLSAVLFTIGYLGSRVLSLGGMSDASNNPNIYFYLYSLTEPWMMLGGAILCIATRVIIGLDIQLPNIWQPQPDGKGMRFFVYLGLPAIVLTVCVAGTFAIMHNYAFSMDEYMADFQAEIFTHGEYVVQVPKDLQPYASAIRPSFVTPHQSGDTILWTSCYWPAYAMIRALFFFAGAPWLTGPLFTAVSVVLVALVARQIWPERTFSEAELVAALLLAVSPQVLLTGMTPYAMPGHLCLNLLWLWLFLKNKTWSLVLACLVGFVAIMLHKPTLHTFFVFPLLFRLVLDRRWTVAASFAAFYALSLYIAVYKIGPFVAPNVLGEKAPPADIASQIIQHLFSSLSLPLLFSWEALPVIVLCGVSLWNWRRLPPVIKDLAIGIAIVYVAHYFARNTQGHGWGHRYCHGVLGSLVLLAVAGWPWLVAWAGRARAGTFLAFGLALALCVQLPYRAICAEHVIRPFALSQQFLAAQPERFIVLDTKATWYGKDLVRNGPYFNPNQSLIVRSDLLIGAGDPIVALDNLRLQGTVRIIRPDEFEKLGLRALSPAALKRSK